VLRGVAGGLWYVDQIAGPTVFVHVEMMLPVENVRETGMPQTRIEGRFQSSISSSSDRRVMDDAKVGRLRAE